MASPPPPYANVTGISRAVMKDSPQESFANYNGNARPGELVVNLDVSPPTLYIGNSLGNLNQVTGNGGGNASLPLANGNSQFDIATANGNVTITANGAETWTFGSDGLLTFPGTPRIDTDADNFEVQAAENINFEANAVVNIYTDGGNNAYQWQFGDDAILILADGNSTIQSIANSSLDPTNPNVSTMVLTPDPNFSSQVLVLDPTAPGHIHLRAFASSNIDEPAANIFLGGENTAFEVTSGSNNQALIHSNNFTWTFGNDGVLTVVGNLVANGASPAPSISGFSSINTIFSITTPVPLANLVATAGARAFASDSNLAASGNFGANISNGGSNTVPVWSDGTNWYIG